MSKEIPPASIPSGKSLRRRLLLWLGLPAALAVVVLAYWMMPRSYDEPPLAYSGSTAELSSTVVVPTLNTPMPAGKNVIWCSSFQLAWNRLKDDVVKGPVIVDKAGSVCKRLNAAPHSDADLPAGSFYAASGFGKATAELIRTEMAQRCPSVKVLDLDDVAGRDILAYAYLAANVKFDTPYFENDERMLFKGKTPVASFGIRPKDDYAYYELRRQIEILYATDDWAGTPKEGTEFALDPCKTSDPCQIVLARIKPGGTLQDSLDDLKRKRAAFAKREYADHYRKVGPNDAFLAPNINYEIAHHFTELEGTDKVLKNAGFEGYWVRTAMQTIRFKLDRSGAELASQAKVHVAPVPRFFFFDGPFLIYVKKRKAEHPFFVMWVDNPELLCKPQDAAP